MGVLHPALSFGHMQLGGLHDVFEQHNFAHVKSQGVRHYRMTEGISAVLGTPTG